MLGWGRLVLWAITGAIAGAFLSFLLSVVGYRYMVTHPQPGSYGGEGFIFLATIPIGAGLGLALGAGAYWIRARNSR